MVASVPELTIRKRSMLGTNGELGQPVRFRFQLERRILGLFGSVSHAVNDCWMCVAVIIGPQEPICQCIAAHPSYRPPRRARRKRGATHTLECANRRINPSRQNVTGL